MNSVPDAAPSRKAGPTDLVRQPSAFSVGAHSYLEDTHDGYVGWLARGTDQFANIRAVLDDALVEDPETGRYQVRRSVFTDEQLFELEMTHIFEGNWIYLAHE